MSRFFDDLEAQLHAAARREVAGGPERAADVGSRGSRPDRRMRWFGWLRAGLRTAPVALAVLLTLAVVGGAIALLGHGSGQGGGSGPAGGGPSGTPSGLASVVTPQIRRELRYIEQADRRVLAQPSCRAPSGTSTSRVIHRRPGRQLLSLLGTLRRPATARDRLGGLSQVGGVDVYAGYTRFGRDVGGHRLYLVAGRSTPAQYQPSPRCFAAERSALVALLPTIPARLRAATERLDARLLAYLRSTLRPQDIVCLVDRGGGGSDTSCGYTASELRNGQGGNETTEGPGAAGGVNITIVPDGVATVSMTWAAVHGRPAATATGNVVNNLAAVRIPGYRSGGTETVPLARSVTWRSATGRVLRTWTAPASGAAGLCRQNPIACIAVMGSATSGSSGGSVQASSSSASATATTASPPSRP